MKHHQARLADVGVSASVTESDVLRGLVAKAVKELDEPPPPPPPAPRATIPKPATPHPKLTVVGESALPASTDANELDAEDFPVSWGEEQRSAHRACASFFATHPTVTKTALAGALGIEKKNLATLNRFLGKSQRLPPKYLANLDAALASLS